MLKQFYQNSDLNELGRSMIEMLGTLAVIGILSVGGIAGYRYSIEKYYANETMDELNTRSIMYASFLENNLLSPNETITTAEFGNKTSLGYTITATVSAEYAEEFNITLSNVPANVCAQILKNYPTPVEILVNESKYNDITQNISICGTDTATMIFAFKQNLSNRWEEVEISDLPEVTA